VAAVEAVDRSAQDDPNRPTRAAYVEVAHSESSEEALQSVIVGRKANEPAATGVAIGCVEHLQQKRA
jgi:hypothetical protein